MAAPGRGTGRVSIAGLLCVKPGERTRLIYRTTVYHGRKHEPKGFGSADFAALLTDAHQQLRGPIMVVWDNLPAHVSAPMQAWIAARADWLLVYRLPPYAPELNPTEGVWANLKGKCEVAAEVASSQVIWRSRWRSGVGSHLMWRASAQGPCQSRS
ncbi:hypothetical protein FHR32_002472 [Streptosporangium album]|uniref:Tc1-like transposase DDE domain-containing protein n=1 Tax=Streptosporangium album TaxID=47479 RepID=A0A7W7RUH4_9ACTN|nr:hypothetical protein [Streptosporangium album]